MEEVEYLEEYVEEYPNVIPQILNNSSIEEFLPVNEDDRFDLLPVNTNFDEFIDEDPLVRRYRNDFQQNTNAKKNEVITFGDQKGIFRFKETADSSTHKESNKGLLNYNHSQNLMNSNRPEPVAKVLSCKTIDTSAIRNRSFPFNTSTIATSIHATRNASLIQATKTTKFSKQRAPRNLFGSYTKLNLNKSTDSTLNRIVAVRKSNCSLIGKLKPPILRGTANIYGNFNEKIIKYKQDNPELFPVKKLEQTPKTVQKITAKPVSQPFFINKNNRSLNLKDKKGSMFKPNLNVKKFSKYATKSMSAALIMSNESLDKDLSSSVEDEIDGSEVVGEEIVKTNNQDQIDDSDKDSFDGLVETLNEYIEDESHNEENVLCSDRFDSDTIQSQTIKLDIQPNIIDPGTHYLNLNKSLEPRKQTKNYERSEIPAHEQKNNEESKSKKTVHFEETSETKSSLRKNESVELHNSDNEDSTPIRSSKNEKTKVQRKKLEKININLEEKTKKEISTHKPAIVSNVKTTTKSPSARRKSATIVNIKHKVELVKPENNNTGSEKHISDKNDNEVENSIAKNIQDNLYPDDSSLNEKDINEKTTDLSITLQNISDTNSVFSELEKLEELNINIEESTNFDQKNDEDVENSDAKILTNHNIESEKETNKIESVCKVLNPVCVDVKINSSKCENESDSTAINENEDADIEFTNPDKNVKSTENMVSIPVKFPKDKSQQSNPSYQIRSKPTQKTPLLLCKPNIKAKSIGPKTDSVSNKNQQDIDKIQEIDNVLAEIDSVMESIHSEEKKPKEIEILNSNSELLKKTVDNSSLKKAKRDSIDLSSALMDTDVLNKRNKLKSSETENLEIKNPPQHSKENETTLPKISYSKNTTLKLKEISHTESDENLVVIQPKEFQNAEKPNQEIPVENSDSKNSKRRISFENAVRITNKSQSDENLPTNKETRYEVKHLIKPSKVILLKTDKIYTVRKSSTENDPSNREEIESTSDNIPKPKKENNVENINLGNTERSEGQANVEKDNVSEDVKEDVKAQATSDLEHTEDFIKNNENFMKKTTFEKENPSKKIVDSSDLIIKNEEANKEIKKTFSNKNTESIKNLNKNKSESPRTIIRTRANIKIEQKQQNTQSVLKKIHKSLTNAEEKAKNLEAQSDKEVEDIMAKKLEVNKTNSTNIISPKETRLGRKRLLLSSMSESTGSEKIESDSSMITSPLLEVNSKRRKLEQELKSKSNSKDKHNENLKEVTDLQNIDKSKSGNKLPDKVDITPSLNKNDLNSKNVVENCVIDKKEKRKVIESKRKSFNDEKAHKHIEKETVNKSTTKAESVDVSSQSQTLHFSKERDKNFEKGNNKDIKENPVEKSVIEQKNSFTVGKEMLIKCKSPDNVEPKILNNDRELKDIGKFVNDEPTKAKKLEKSSRDRRSTESIVCQEKVSKSRKSIENVNSQESKTRQIIDNIEHNQNFTNKTVEAITKSKDISKNIIVTEDKALQALKEKDKGMINPINKEVEENSIEKSAIEQKNLTDEKEFQNKGKFSSNEPDKVKQLEKIRNSRKRRSTDSLTDICSKSKDISKNATEDLPQHSDQPVKSMNYTCNEEIKEPLIVQSDATSQNSIDEEKLQNKGKSSTDKANKIKLLQKPSRNRKIIGNIGSQQNFVTKTVQVTPKTKDILKDVIISKDKIFQTSEQTDKKIENQIQSDVGQKKSINEKDLSTPMCSNSTNSKAMHFTSMNPPPPPKPTRQRYSGVKMLASALNDSMLIPKSEKRRNDRNKNILASKTESTNKNISKSNKDTLSTIGKIIRRRQSNLVQITRKEYEKVLRENIIKKQKQNKFNNKNLFSKFGITKQLKVCLKKMSDKSIQKLKQIQSAPIIDPTNKSIESGVLHEENILTKNDVQQNSVDEITLNKKQIEMIETSPKGKRKQKIKKGDEIKINLNEPQSLIKEIERIDKPETDSSNFCRTDRAKSMPKEISNEISKQTNKQPVNIDKPKKGLVMRVSLNDRVSRRDTARTDKVLERTTRARSVPRNTNNLQNDVNLKTRRTTENLNIEIDDTTKIFRNLRGKTPTPSVEVDKNIEVFDGNQNSKSRTSKSKNRTPRNSQKIQSENKIIVDTSPARTTNSENSKESNKSPSNNLQKIQTENDPFESQLSINKEEETTKKDELKTTKAPSKSTNQNIENSELTQKSWFPNENILIENRNELQQEISVANILTSSTSNPDSVFVSTIVPLNQLKPAKSSISMSSPHQSKKQLQSTLKATSLQHPSQVRLLPAHIVVETVFMTREEYDLKNLKKITPQPIPAQVKQKTHSKIAQSIVESTVSTTFTNTSKPISSTNRDVEAILFKISELLENQIKSESRINISETEEIRRQTQRLNNVIKMKPNSDNALQVLVFLQNYFFNVSPPETFLKLPARISSNESSLLSSTTLPSQQESSNDSDKCFSFKKIRLQKQPDTGTNSAIGQKVAQTSKGTNKRAATISAESSIHIQPPSKILRSSEKQLEVSSLPNLTPQLNLLAPLSTEPEEILPDLELATASIKEETPDEAIII